MRKILLAALIISILLSCKQVPTYDTIIRNGLIYDGNGGDPYKADIGLNADTIAFIGNLTNSKAKNETDAKGMSVAPGFINMMGHSEESLFEDGRSQCCHEKTIAEWPG